jgi:PKD repeat protein
MGTLISGREGFWEGVLHLRKLETSGGSGKMSGEVVEPRIAKLTATSLAAWLLIPFVLSGMVGPLVVAQTHPTVSLTVYRVQEVDPIDLTLGDWDWYYYVGIFEGIWTWFYYQAPNGMDVIINETHDFAVPSTLFTFSLVFCEGDFWTNDDRADISANETSGSDDVADCIPTPGDVPTGAYVGYWDLVTGSLSGDYTVKELGYYRTSGDYDGSTGDDENDANVWFDITDDYSPPIADAGPDKSGYLGDTIGFDASGSSGSAGSTIDSYEWDFDDDGSYDSSAKIDTWTFSSKGVHTVRLRVIDSLGVQAYDTTTVEILNMNPIASFSYGPLNSTTEDDIAFADTSTDADGTIDSWNWSFGDGEFSQEQNPIHRYSEAGEFTISLEVTDNDGDKDTFTQAIVVEQAEEGLLGDLEDSWLWILVIVILVVFSLIIAYFLLRRKSNGEGYTEINGMEEQPPIQ